MMKFVSALMVAVTLSVGVVGATADAEARQRRVVRQNNDAAAALAVGLIGAAIVGGMIAANNDDGYHHPRRHRRVYQRQPVYDGGYYGGGYYGGGYVGNQQPYHYNRQPREIRHPAHRNGGHDRVYYQERDFTPSINTFRNGSR